MKEIAESVQKYISERASSVMYWTFFLSWLTINWKLWYVTFFVDAELLFKKTSLLKIEYIQNLFVIHYWWDIVLCFWSLLIFPALMVFIIHWALCKWDIRVFEKNIDNQYTRKFYKLRKEQSLQYEREKLARKEDEALTQEIRNIEKAEMLKRAQEEAKERGWKNKYKNLSWIDRRLMEDFFNVIYKHEGFTKKYEWNIRVGGLLSWDALYAFLDTNDLAIYDSWKYLLTPTEKWKYFLKLYREEIESNW